jgi:hypothetical protein
VPSAALLVLVIAQKDRAVPSLRMECETFRGLNANILDKIDLGRIGLRA